MKTFSYLTLLLGSVSAPLAHADLLDLLGLRKNPADTNTASSTSLAALSQDQVAGGLKQALAKGLDQAIARLGHDGGFLTNLEVHIPMPEKLHAIERTLRSLGQDKLADDFVATMNHAAEQAVPEAAPVFADAVKQMTIADAKAILLGTNDAATAHFKSVTQTNLAARFRPIVQKATAKTGATAAYKNMMGKIGSSKLGGVVAELFNQDTLDLDSYVTDKALDGLFKMVADEEKRIRQNPTARTTELLQKVFGSISRQSSSERQGS